METFTKKVLSFDEDSYQNELLEYQNFCDLVTSCNNELKEDYQINLNNPIAEKIFLNFESNPDNFFDNEVYNEIKSKILRDESREDIKQFIRRCISSLKLYSSSIPHGIQIKKGVASVTEKAKTSLREKYENTLDTNRSENLLKLHHEASEKINEFLSLAGEKDSKQMLFWQRYFLTTENSLTKPQNLNYNNL